MDRPVALAAGLIVIVLVALRHVLAGKVIGSVSAELV
jgi:hypothetical protein